MTDRRSVQAQRVFEQPGDAVSLYSDFVQVVQAEHEVYLQFYDTIPGPPVEAQGGQAAPNTVRTRLRVTIVLTPSFARKIVDLIKSSVTLPEASTAQAGPTGGTTS